MAEPARRNGQILNQITGVRAPVTLVSAASAISSPATTRYTHAVMSNPAPPIAVATYTRVASPPHGEGLGEPLLKDDASVVHADRLKSGEHLAGRNRVSQSPRGHDGGRGVGKGISHAVTITRARSRNQSR